MKIFASDGKQRNTDPNTYRTLPSFRHQTTTNFTKWYGPGTSFSAPTRNDGVAPVANSLLAFPYVFEVPVTVYELAMYVTSTGVNGFRFGLYDNYSEDILYPNKLLVDSGAQSGASTGLKAAPAIIYLAAGLYWFVSLFESVADPQFARFEATNTHGYAWANLGTPNVSTNTLATPQLGWFISYTYGSLPEVFPSSDNAATPRGAQVYAATTTQTPIPAVLARLT